MERKCENCTYLDHSTAPVFCLKLQCSVTYEFCCEHHTFRQVFDETLENLAINPKDDL